MPEKVKGTKNNERVYLITTSDPEFSLLGLKRRHNFDAKELNRGTHLIKVGENGAYKFEAWIDYNLRPKTVDGVHALIQVIMHLTADYFNLTMEQLCGRLREARLVDARKIAVFLCCEAFRTPINCDVGMTSPFVDMIAANVARTRATINYYDDWVRDRLDILPDFRSSIAVLKKQIVSRLPINEHFLAEKIGRPRIQGRR